MYEAAATDQLVRVYSRAPHDPRRYRRGRGSCSHRQGNTAGEPRCHSPSALGAGYVGDSVRAWPLCEAFTIALFDGRNKVLDPAVDFLGVARRYAERARVAVACFLRA